MVFRFYSKVLSRNAIQIKTLNSKLFQERIAPEPPLISSLCGSYRESESWCPHLHSFTTTLNKSTDNVTKRNSKIFLHCRNRWKNLQTRIASEVAPSRFRSVALSVKRSSPQGLEVIIVVYPLLEGDKCTE